MTDAGAIRTPMGVRIVFKKHFLGKTETVMDVGEDCEMILQSKSTHYPVDLKDIQYMEVFGGPEND